MNTNSQYDFSSLNGKIAIITGGAGILGKHFSEGLASCGSHVVIVDLNKKMLEIGKKRIKKGNVRFYHQNAES